MSTIKVSNLQHASAANPAIVLAADGSATAQLSSLNGGPLAGARNRIINGDMRIDQRNNGAAVTPSGGTGYFSCDRWQQWLSQNSKYSIQRSTVAPAGFANSLLATSLSAYTVLTTDNFALNQNIEGFNAQDLGWGTASASSITLSFWVRSSLTGTFGGAFSNSAVNRSYPFTYTISAANTWEQKAVTIAGDTTGTWLTDNGIGIRLWFSIGAGSTYLGTAGSWAGADYRGATGQTSVVGTSGATFYITGVQLEPGTVATPFERRSYGQELALCQRYALATNGSCGLAGVATNTNTIANSFHFPVFMRSAPTLSTSVTGSAEYSDLYAGNVTAASSSYNLSNANNASSLISIAGFTGLTIGRFYSGRPGFGTAVILFSAEL